jgi:hypothetical protein
MNVSMNFSDKWVEYCYGETAKKKLETLCVSESDLDEDEKEDKPNVEQFFLQFLKDTCNNLTNEEIGTNVLGTVDDYGYFDYDKFDEFLSASEFCSMIKESNDWCRQHNNHDLIKVANLSVHYVIKKYLYYYVNITDTTTLAKSMYDYLEDSVGSSDEDNDAETNDDVDAITNQVNEVTIDDLETEIYI